MKGGRIVVEVIEVDEALGVYNFGVDYSPDHATPKQIADVLRVVACGLERQGADHV